MPDRDGFSFTAPRAQTKGRCLEVWQRDGIDAAGARHMKAGELCQGNIQGDTYENVTHAVTVQLPAQLRTGGPGVCIPVVSVFFVTLIRTL